MEARFSGQLYLGKTAQARAAKLIVTNGIAKFESLDGQSLAELPLSDLKIAVRIGSVPRVFEALSGIRFETFDFSAVEELEKQNRKSQTIHRAESNWWIAIPIALTLFLSVIVIYKIVIPKLSSFLAPLVPASVANEISRPMEKFVRAISDDKIVLSAEEQLRFDTAVSDFGKRFPGPNGGSDAVEILRSSNANAFILPNGHIFVTTRLIAISESSDEILSVLLHERGHAHYHHVIQNLLESSALSLLIITITGGTEWTNVPVLALGNSYSQFNELMADKFAAKELKSMGKSPKTAAKIFKALQLETKSSDHIPAFLSTHPTFDERIRLMENLSTQ